MKNTNAYCTEGLLQFYFRLKSAFFKENWKNTTLKYYSFPMVPWWYLEFEQVSRLLHANKFSHDIVILVNFSIYIMIVKALVQGNEKQ